MPGFFWYIIVLAVALTVGFLWTELRRRTGTLRVRAFGFPKEWLPYLEENVPIYKKMPKELREDYQIKVMNFLEHKRFVGCGDLGEGAVTDEMKVTIAGNACLLLLNRRVQPFKKVLSVLVYPSSFFNSREDEVELMSGEAWPGGSVVLAWDAARKTSRDLRDGKNLVLHEFAHQLDLENGGEANGFPFVEDMQTRSWAKVLSAEFQKHVEATAQGRYTVIDKYGAEAPAEFFAVATEAFFERPTHLLRHHPDLYEQLRLFYKVDPARWNEES